jgi:hypothetical protein
MATTDYNVKFDLKVINHIKPFLPKEYELCEKMMAHGMYQRDRLVEKALSLASEGLIEMDSQDNWDFDDKSDSKSNTVNYRKSKGVHGIIRIASVKNKIYLRALIYDPKRNIFRYFAVWDWPSTITDIEFSANLNTNSKYLNGLNGIELNSFKELAQFNFKNK